MVIYMIGLGLDDEKDISLKGLEAIKRCRHVYLEDYTSILNVPISGLEKLYGKKVIPLSREKIEVADTIFSHPNEDVALLVVGDVFSATTHVDLFLRAKEHNVRVQVIHNASIMTAIGETGLELYKFGKTTSMPYFEKSYMPQSPYDAVLENLMHGLHTLILLDIKRSENRFMSVNECLRQFTQIEDVRKKGIFSDRSLVVGCARLGSEHRIIKYGTVMQLMDSEFGEPLHCLIYPGKLHFMEEDMLKLWKV
jgi:diphthine methyl ester synthase